MTVALQQPLLQPVARKAVGARGLLASLSCALCVALSLASSGCGKEEAPRPAPVKKKIVRPQKAAPSPKADREAKTEEGTTTPAAQPSAGGGQPITAFRPHATRDPFRSFIKASRPTASVKRKKGAARIRTPLERYSLDQLKVVGIVSGAGMREALLEDDVGKGYVVHVGDPVGSEGGRIAAIKKDRIVVEKTYVDALGNKKVRRITKKLYTAEEGENP